MNYPNLHSWSVNVQQAIQIQENLRKRIILTDNLPKIQRIAAVDVAFFSSQAVCAVCIFDYPDLNILKTVMAKKTISFPYVPGLLTFREGPAILAAFKKLETKPDLALFDGQGICHPRRMGIATHLGIILNIPSIGCAKSHLYGTYKMPGNHKGDFSFIYASGGNIHKFTHDSKKREIIGVALRTRNYVKPIFLSCGYRISLNSAIKLILKLSSNYRIPEPLRYAHRMAENAKELSI